MDEMKNVRLDDDVLEAIQVLIDKGVTIEMLEQFYHTEGE